jgi:hypothetical protein
LPERWREVLQGLRYDQKQFLPLVARFDQCEYVVKLSFRQPSYALPLRGTDDLQPLALDLYLLSDVYFFRQFRQLVPF